VRHKTTSALLLVGAMMLGASAASAQVREQRPNLVGGELMGRGIVLTANYERFFTNQFGIGAGFMGIGASDGFVGIIPLYGSLLLGDSHALYLGGGASILFGEGSIDDDFRSEALATLSFGYQFQSYGGFFVRPVFTFFFNDDDFLFWPGITIGGSF
jgi:hypothetical protein